MDNNNLYGLGNMTDFALSIIPLTRALEISFDKINAQFFGGKIPRPLITIKEDVKHKAMGWVTVAPVWARFNSQGENIGDPVHELNISPDFLKAPLHEVAETLFHEMLHLWNILHDIEDVTRGGTYHNKKYSAKAGEHGLEGYKRDAKNGYSVRLMLDTAAWVGDYLMELDEQKTIYRDILLKATKKAKKPYKYTCPICGAMVKGTKKFTLRCEECDEAMVMEAPDDADESLTDAESDESGEGGAA